MIRKSSRNRVLLLTRFPVFLGATDGTDDKSDEDAMSGKKKGACVSSRTRLPDDFLIIK